MDSRRANPKRVRGPEGDRVYSVDGDIIRGRDRYSIAELSQYALEWRGQFAETRSCHGSACATDLRRASSTSTATTPNGGNGSSGTIGPAGGVLCTNRTPLTTTANGNVTSCRRPRHDSGREFHPPYSET
jgi:iron complex outermembrane receptor protein